MANLETKFFSRYDLEKEFKNSPLATIAEFCIDKPLGPWKAKITEKETMKEISWKGIFVLNDGSYLTQEQFKLVLSKPKLDHSLYLLSAAHLPKRIEGRMSISPQIYQSITKEATIGVVYALAKSLLNQKSEEQKVRPLQFIVDNEVHVLHQEQNFDQTTLASYYDTLCSRLYDWWQSKEIIITPENAEKKIKANNKTYEINQEMLADELHFCLGHSAGQLIANYRRDRQDPVIITKKQLPSKKGIQRIYTTAKSILYYANIDLFKGNHSLLPQNVRKILFVQSGEENIATELFGFDIYQSTSQRIVRQAYNKLFEDTLQLLYKH